MPFTVSFHSECEFCEYDEPHGMRVNLIQYDYHPEGENGNGGLIIEEENEELILEEEDEELIIEDNIIIDASYSQFGDIGCIEEVLLDLGVI